MKRDFKAAAIDAPFSLPLEHIPKGGHPELLRQVRLLPDGSDRPFPLGASIVALGEAVTPKLVPKPLRRTEAYWAARGVNTRSTMWNGPRGGAPFAAACLRLLERTELPLWPWSELQVGMLAEAFPAAQLQHWGLLYQGYSKPSAENFRKSILVGLHGRIGLSPLHTRVLLQNADALDAVISAFAAIALINQTVVDYKPVDSEGVIAVAR
jgi:hypothetical protein